VAFRLTVVDPALISAASRIDAVAIATRRGLLAV
jgi:hypothetical protein